jgi:hypothetical protein
MYPERKSIPPHPHIPLCCVQGQREFTPNLIQRYLPITEQQGNEISPLQIGSFKRDIRSLDPRDCKILPLKASFRSVYFPFKTDLTVLNNIVNLDYIVNKHD